MSYPDTPDGYYAGRFADAVESRADEIAQEWVEELKAKLRGVTDIEDIQIAAEDYGLCDQAEYLPAYLFGGDITAARFYEIEAIINDRASIKAAEEQAWG